MTSSCGLGFAHDVDTQVARARALRSQLATNGISTVCSGYMDSLLHILVLYGSCLKYRCPRNSEAHLDRTLAITNEVSTRSYLMLECFSCF